MMGMRIAALRRRAGMSQRDLAAALSVSPSTIGMYEQGRREPSADRLVAMSQLFHVSTDYLLTGKPTADPDTLLDLYRHLQNAGFTLRRSDGQELPLPPTAVASLLCAVLEDA